MHGLDSGVGAAGNTSYRDLILYPRRKSGKSIRRQIERRFDAVLGEIASGDAAVIMQLPHARWLLDNSHLVRQALQQVETDLPAGYHRQLPAVVLADGHKVPRVFTLVDQVIEQYGLPIDCGLIERFCRDYRSVAPAPTRLTLGELWAVPIALRITLLTQLCAAAEISQKDAKQGIEFAHSSEGVTGVAGCITASEPLLHSIGRNLWSAPAWLNKR